VIPAIEERFRYGNPERLRAVAASALAEVGRRVTPKDAVRETLQEGLKDRDFRVQMASIAALAHLEDARATPALAVLQDQTPDGRVRRAARGAVQRLRKSGERSQESGRLADEVETLRKRNADLLSRLERVEVRLGPPAARRARLPKVKRKRKRP
jgi:aminopeptidase N